MNWGNIFKMEEKPINIYESSLFDEWLDTFMSNVHSKSVYQGYADRLSEWIRINGMTTVDKSGAERFLKHQVAISGAKQGNARWSIFKRYCDWLITKGKLTVNPWAEADLIECGCDKEAVSIEYAKKKAERNAKLEAAKAREAENEKRTEETSEETPMFTLSDVAMLLIAIEEKDEEAIKEVLFK